MRRFLLACAAALILGGSAAHALQAITADTHQGAPAAFTQAISFRATSGAITDAEKQAYSLGASDSADYPITPICNGCSSAGDSTGVGWVDRTGISAFANNSGWSTVLKGSNYAGTGISKTYNIDLPAGSYKFYCAFGNVLDITAATTITLKDGGSTVGTITGSDPGTGNMEASDAVAYTAVAGGTWDNTGSTKKVDFTMTGTTLSIVLTGVASNIISYLKVTNQ